MIQFTVWYIRGNDEWKKLTDTYPTFNRAATIATALENRGYRTQIFDVRDSGHVPSIDI